MCLPAARPRLADLTGIFLSLTCLIHCLALPLAILLAPALSRWIALPEGVHAAILLLALPAAAVAMRDDLDHLPAAKRRELRSEEHTSELQSLMRISYAVFCLKKKNNTNNP